jgi:hypothetical protein
MSHRVVTEAKLPEEPTKYIEADCWGIFTTTEDRKRIARVYHDERQAASADVPPEELKTLRDKEQRERDRLCADPSDLLADIKQRHTVVVVMGGDEFR